MVPEIVICAAIRVSTGEIIRGHRHGDCFNSFKAKKLKQDGVNIATAEQGFITSCNRFVDRVEGMKLQLAAGIASVAEGGYRGQILFSEDLY